MQNHYSLTYREEEREMNAYCNFAGIGLIPWGPLHGGQLARPYKQSEEQPTTRGTAEKTMPWYQCVRRSLRPAAMLTPTAAQA
jgi:aryl-alcohol dehydrogenase-like predicted oxidoreductase